MGEVRVKVKLSNVADQAAAADGRLPHDQVRYVETDAMKLQKYIAERL